MKKIISLLLLVLFTFACAPVPTPKTIIIVVTATPLPVTITPSLSPSSIPTMTLDPTSTSTATSTLSSAMQKAINSTATQQAKITSKTQTALAKQEYLTRVAPYIPMSGTDIDIYYQMHLGVQVKVRGKIGMFLDTRHFTIMAEDHRYIAVQLQSPATDLYEGDWVTIYGKIDGKSRSFSWTNGINNTLLIDAFYEKK